LFDIADDRIARAQTRGLFLSANAGEISARLLKAAVAEGASSLVISLEGFILALPPPTPQHYRYVPPEMRSIPVALVVNEEQLDYFQSVGTAAAQAGTLRRAFRGREEAQAWLREQPRALNANRAWWSRHRSAQ